jgi:uncharacterized protein
MRFFNSVLFLFLSISVFAQVQKAPNPPRLVNDFADMLSSQEELALERKLVAFNDSTSNQIAVITIETLGDYDIASYAAELGRDWGIGDKKNNGAFILISKAERKGYVAVGYGLEGAIPDATAKQIYQNYVRPQFQSGNYYKGLDDGTTIMMQLATGEYKQVRDKGKKGKGISLGAVLLIIFVILFIVGKMRSVKRNHYSSGGGGMDWLTALLLMNTMGGGRGGSGSNWNDFSSGGGDFGGFGGGDFGGGGAGGDW